MKVAYFQQFGKVDVLEVGDLPTPTYDANQLLIRVHASAINPKDTFIRKGRFQRLTGKRFPMFTGFDLAGEIASLGANVQGWQIGQAVYGMLDGWYGGTCAEYVVVSPQQIGIKPHNLSFAEASAVPLVALTALQALRDEGNIQKGMRVCINGASGGVGSMAIQIAKAFGAHVTAISSPANHDFCRSIGADAIFDYTQGSITQSGQTFDIFFDVFGNASFNQIAPILTANGRYISTVIQPHVFLSVFLSRFLSRKKAKLVVVKANTADFDYVRAWLETETIRPIIHATYPLAEIREAHRQQETKHTRGKIVVTI